MSTAEQTFFFVLGWLAAMCFAAPAGYQALVTLGLI
jgi:hypothetical protein